MLSADQIIYEAVAQAARQGTRCPTNATLAGLIGASSPSTAVCVLQRLNAQGRIRLHSGNCRRVVEVPALMMRTAGPLPVKHWRERNGEKINDKAPLSCPRVRVFEPARPAVVGGGVVDNRACTRCGARKGLCGHEERWLSCA